MSDIRESMREFRFLEEKRKLAPLTEAEEQRWIELGRILGIFEHSEANPDDVVEVDPNDVLLVEPGPDESASAPGSGPDAPTPPAVDTAADEGDSWNGVDDPQAAESPVIDLSASDATPGGGCAILATPEPTPSDASGAANGAPPEPPVQPANNMPEAWGGQAAAQAFPQTSPQFPNPIETPSASVLEGERRVVIHLLDGQVRRGSVRDLDVAAANVPLESASGVEDIPVDRLKAIFFMLAPGSEKLSALGQKIRLTFQDGRQVSGFSTDYQTGDPGFFLIPADLKTNTERIFVYRWSVDSIAEE